MKLVSLLHNNFYYTSDLTDMAARSTPINFSYLQNDEEHWHQKLSNEYVKNLSDYVTRLSFGLEDVPNISDQDIADMVEVLTNYTKAQKGAFLSFQNFFAENSEIKKRYTDHLLGEEGLYEEESQSEIIHMQGVFNVPNDEIKNGIDSYTVRVMLSFDNPVLVNEINSILDYDERHKELSKAIEEGQFLYVVDIKKQDNYILKTVATYNNQNGVIAEANNNSFLLYQLNDMMHQDALSLESFSNNNAAFNDFYKQFEFIAGIIKHCKNDNLMNPVTRESIVGFKEWINEQKTEKALNSQQGMNQALDMITKIRNNSKGNDSNNGISKPSV